MTLPYLVSAVRMRLMSPLFDRVIQIIVSFVLLAAHNGQSIIGVHTYREAA